MQNEEYTEKSVKDYTTHEERAMAYAEKYGICEYIVKGGTMVYYTAWPAERTTYKVTVDLEAVSETREPMKRYYKPFKHIGKCQVNYMA